MNELYSEPSPGKKAPNYGPSEETVSFLLGYSQALNIVSYKSMKF